MVGVCGYGVIWTPAEQVLEAEEIAERSFLHQYGSKDDAAFQNQLRVAVDVVELEVPQDPLGAAGALLGRDHPGSRREHVRRRVGRDVEPQV